MLQICDSSFPSGAFSHSYGLETYIQEGKISDKESFFRAICSYIVNQLVNTDGLACRFGIEHLSSECFSQLIELDHLLYAASLANETRTGNRRIGTRMAKLCDVLYRSDNLRKYLNLIEEKHCYGHPALVFAIVCHELLVDKNTAVGAYLYATVSALIQNGVRGIPLGQTEGQLLLVECQPIIHEGVSRINQLTMNDFGAVSPGLEIAQMIHEQLHVRLFMS